jgi:hypothetical protein
VFVYLDLNRILFFPIYPEGVLTNSEYQLSSISYVLLCYGELWRVPASYVSPPVPPPNIDVRDGRADFDVDHRDTDIHLSRGLQFLS